MIFPELLYLFPIHNLFAQIYFLFTFVFSSICKYFINFSTVISRLIPAANFNKSWLLLSPIRSFFTFLFFLLCLRFTTYTYKHEHAYKSPHFPPNPCNLFFDISHFESFHLFPSSTLSVSPHLLLFMNSSIRLRPRSSYPPSLFRSVNHGTLIILLLDGDVELNPGPSTLNFTHLNIRSIQSFQKSFSLHSNFADHPTEILSLNETLLQPTDSDKFVSSLAPPGYSILHSPRLTGQGGGLALIFRSFLKFKLSRTRNLPPPESFELLATKLSTGNKETIFLNIYRPPSRWPPLITWC